MSTLYAKGFHQEEVPECLLDLILGMDIVLCSCQMYQNGLDQALASGQLYQNNLDQALASCQL